MMKSPYVLNGEGKLCQPVLLVSLAVTLIPAHLYSLRSQLHSVEHCQCQKHADHVLHEVVQVADREPAQKQDRVRDNRRPSAACAHALHLLRLPILLRVKGCTGGGGREKGGVRGEGEGTGCRVHGWVCAYF